MWPCRRATDAASSIFICAHVTGTVPSAECTGVSKWPALGGMQQPGGHSMQAASTHAGLLWSASYLPVNQFPVRSRYVSCEKLPQDSGSVPAQTSTCGNASKGMPGAARAYKLISCTSRRLMASWSGSSRGNHPKRIPDAQSGQHMLRKGSGLDKSYLEPRAPHQSASCC